MHIKLLLEKRFNIIWTLYGGRIGRALLWHTGRDLPGHVSYTRDVVEIKFVRVNAVYLDKASSISEVQSSVSENGVWFQDGNYLYLRVCEPGELLSQANSFPWYAWSATGSVQIGLSNNDFFVSAGMPYYTGIISGYKIKTVCDDKYGVATFSRNTLDVLFDRLKDNTLNYIGTIVDVEVQETGKRLDRQFLETMTGDMNKLTLSTLDFRASLKSNVVNQLFDPNEWTVDVNGTIVTTMDQDVQKKYRQDAMGYCIGVPGICMNGDAKNRSSYRYYWFSYQTNISLQSIEVKMESGWKPITSGYILTNFTTTLANGSVVVVKIVQVNASIVHPPQEGSTQPDYDCTPREVRVSGIFWSTATAGDCTPLNILKYLITRYSQMPWNTTYFNISDITTELNRLFNPIGIVIQKPTALFNVIGQLQNGCIMGWKLCIQNYLFTARAHWSARPAALTIKDTDIKNILNLKFDFQGKKYISDLHVRYAKVWSESDIYSEYTNETIHNEILSKRSSDISGTIDTLLYNRPDAITRYNNAIKTSVNFTPRVIDIELINNKFTTWYNLKEYDIVNLDLSGYYPILTNTKWYVVSMEFETYDESAKISLEGWNG